MEYESKSENIDPREEQFKRYVEDFDLSQEDLRKTLLDVGVDKGEFIKYLRDVLGNKYAIGVEYESSKVDPNYEGIIVAGGMNLPFSEEVFDTVTAHNYLTMFVNDSVKMQKAIEELLRVATKNGKVIGNIHTPESVISCDKSMRQILGKEYHERNNELFLEQYQGAKKLQEYLADLKQEKYKVEYIDEEQNVIMIIKL